MTTQTQIKVGSEGPSPFREDPPDVVSAAVDAATDDDERVWICIATDMADLDVFSERLARGHRPAAADHACQRDTAGR